MRSERTGRLDAITLSVRCSKGTYVRSLARDIAHALGAVGHVTMLRRTGAGPFTLEGAIPLDRLEEIGQGRSEEHTSELQSLMRTSYAVFCLKTKKTNKTTTKHVRNHKHHIA